MCHLLLDTSETVPKISYKILQASAAKYTEHLVLEASVENENTVPLELPLELIQLIQSSIPDEDASDVVREQVSIFVVAQSIASLTSRQLLFGNMLAWMLTFDLFANAVRDIRRGV